MNLQTIIMGCFVVMIIACTFKKNYIGAGLTLGLGFVIIFLVNNPNYWNTGGKTIVDSGINVINTIFKNN
jgi:hypothetical protein